MAAVADVGAVVGVDKVVGLLISPESGVSVVAAAVAGQKLVFLFRHLDYRPAHVALGSRQTSAAAAGLGSRADEGLQFDLVEVQEGMTGQWLDSHRN